jgi:sensor histidine kinase YesM
MAKKKLAFMDKQKNNLVTILLVGTMLPGFVLIINISFFGTVYFQKIKLFVIATVITIVTICLLYLLYIVLGSKMRKKYPKYEQSLHRVITWVTIRLTITPLVLVLLFLFYKKTVFPEATLEDGWKWALVIGIISDILGISINEGTFTFGKWKENIQEAEQLKKANLQTQFEGLKNQVSPHFLFNSINTLSSLIHEDKERAGQFIDEMSNVYRYLLRNNEEELVSLSTELKFIQSYYHLLKTRYGNGIEMKLNIENNPEDYLLPPLTLQLLVENAVKHNNVLKEKPLVIEINTPEDGWLVVKNNLQKKTISVDSSKIGLNNIKEKFRLLEQPDVVIKETATEFIVMLPLLEVLNKA